MSRSVVFELDEGTDPLFVKLARVIARDIERGRLSRGERLPGTRSLAMSLGVHRNTVDAAYHELILQGWIVARPARGHFVADDVASRVSTKKKVRIAARPISLQKKPSSSIAFSEGSPDARLAPHVALSRAFRHALSAPEFLRTSGYGDPRGSLALREALTTYLAEERSIVTSAENVLVTRGSQMALFLIARTLIQPGDAIAVEDPGYPLAWSAFESAGARIIGIPVDEHGIVVDHLARVLTSNALIRGLYLTPHHQYPTTTTLSAGRRQSLLALARQHRLIVVEDDYDHEYRFEGKPVLPMFARAEESVVYVGSLSKLLAPGIRLGYAVATAKIAAQLARTREYIDRQGDVPLEHAVASLIRSGELRRHVHRARRVYRARRDVLIDELHRRLGSVMQVSAPHGGLALWARVDNQLDVRTWSRNALASGLAVKPGSDFALTGPSTRNAFRLGFGDLSEIELRHAARLLVRSMP